MPEPQPPIFDVPALIETSRPRARMGLLWYGAIVFLVFVLSSTFITEHFQQGKVIVQTASSLLMLTIISVMGFLTWLTIRKASLEQKQIEAIDELVQLRRWHQAAMMIGGLLSKPTRTPQARFLALIFLSKVLARYHNFADSISLCDYLLEAHILDEDSAHNLQLERAMSQLKDDRLFDVDRAINELKRTPMAPRSAGLALLQIYRDVKTGHPNEAIAMFTDKLAIMRRQLGHRVADAHVLVAKAYELAGQPESAQTHYTNATLLSPVAELERRYPEVKSLSAICAPAPVPQEAL